MKYLGLLFSLGLCFNAISAVDYSKLSQHRPPVNKIEREPSFFERASAKASEYASFAKSGFDAASAESAKYVSPVIPTAVAILVAVVGELSAQVSTPGAARFKRIGYAVIAGVSGVLALCSFNGVQK